MDEIFMLRALQLAQNGVGKVNPNPLVGCVIVHQNLIIGEGYHQKYGEAHAEVNAINSVVNKELLQNSTLYVTLEPCSHIGKTPPCADLIIKYKIPKVVICNHDPNPLVAGNGIRKLQNAGIEVISGICEEIGNEINKRFFTYFNKKRPYIILKWAQTKDGFIAKDNFDSKWISNSYSRQMVHQWRAEEMAILVGFNTALHDNPSLTCRTFVGNNPIRVILDKNFNLPKSHHIFIDNVPTLIINEIKSDKINHISFIKSNQNIESILEILYYNKINSIIIEGGSQTHQKFIDNNIWDEARVFESDVLFEKGINAPKILKFPFSEIKIQNDVLRIYKNN